MTTRQVTSRPRTAHRRPRSSRHRPQIGSAARDAPTPRQARLPTCSVDCSGPAVRSSHPSPSPPPAIPSPSCRPFSACRHSPRGAPFPASPRPPLFRPSGRPTWRVGPARRRPATRSLGRETSQGRRPARTGRPTWPSAACCWPPSASTTRLPPRSRRRQPDEQRQPTREPSPHRRRHAATRQRHQQGHQQAGARRRDGMALHALAPSAALRRRCAGLAARHPPGPAR